MNELANFYKRRLTTIGFNFSPEKGYFRKKVKTQNGINYFLAIDSELKKLFFVTENNESSFSVELKTGDIHAIKSARDIIVEAGNL